MMLPTGRQRLRLQRPRGVATLVLLTIVLLAVTTIMVTSLSVSQRRTVQVKQDADTLNVAAEALRGYSLRHSIPGSLPCPDTTGDGFGNPAVGGCQRQLGLFPYRTLNTDALTDSSGAALWYAVELALVNNAVGLKNSSTAVSLNIDGLAMVAVLIAPGAAINGQNRVLLNTTDFLEGINADASMQNYSDVSDVGRNDHLLGISQMSHWTLVSKVAVNEARNLLLAYQASCGEFPFAAAIGGTGDSVNGLQHGLMPFLSALPEDWGAACAGGAAPVPASWLLTHWADEIQYRMCTSVEGSCLMVTGDSNQSAAAVVVSAGSALSGQNRPSAQLSDYFENENGGAPDNEFRFHKLANLNGSFNDILRVVSP